MDSPPQIREALLPIVIKHFEGFSTSQWCLLAAGTCDSTIRASLADLITDIVQKLVTDFVRMTLPEFEVAFITRTPSQTHWATALKELDMFRGDSLSGIFADALHVPEFKCKRAEELTARVEWEVSQKLQCIEAMVTSSPARPRQPAVYVKGSMSSTKSLQQMVCCAALCLGNLIDQRLCYWLKQRSFSCETEHRNTFKISFLSAVEKVTEILMKWSGTRTASEESDGARTERLEAQRAAFDIVMHIWNDLRSESRLLKPCFNMALTFDRVIEFFASQAEKGFFTITYPLFSAVVKKEFEKMMANLKSALIRKDKQFLLSLAPGPQASQLTLVESCDSHRGDDTLLECDLFSATHTPANISPTSRGTLINGSKRQRQETFKAAFLLNVQNQQEKLASEKLGNMKSSGKIMTFSWELVDKIYDFLMPDRTYPKPQVPSGTCLSDSVLSESTVRVDNSYFSPEVLYALIEDAVEKFLQQVLLWMYNESAETTCCEVVAGAIADIEDLIAMATTSELTSHVHQQPDFPARKYKIYKSRFCAVLPLDEDEKEEVARHLITSFSQSLITELLRHDLGPPRMKDVDTIIVRLSQMLKVAIEDIHLNTQIFEKEFKKVTKNMITLLHMKFGPPDKLQQTLLSNDTSFYYAVIKYLQIHLNYLRNQQPTKSAVARFFSALGRKIDHVLEVFIFGSPVHSS
ncbi:hypothetical protein JOB18_034741 [Solea senegalensis]|uniref:Uncharacterized protein n=1 Tax=Solea senegalensis TaxID=28829 RepID=A0AAV6S1F5_SOLSE|nr:hypothetical protein JOB18_034741 [Solea senegalensis]